MHLDGTALAGGSRPQLDLATSSGIARWAVADASSALEALASSIASDRPLGWTAVADAEAAVRTIEHAGSAIHGMPVFDKAVMWTAGVVHGAAQRLRADVLRPLYRIEDGGRDALTEPERVAFLAAISSARAPLEDAAAVLARYGAWA